jgi:hypothetical protein
MAAAFLTRSSAVDEFVSGLHFLSVLAFDILQSGPWPTGGATRPDLDIVDRQSGDREWRLAALNGSIRPKAMDLFSRKAGAEMSLFTSRQSNGLD